MELLSQLRVELSTSQQNKISPIEPCHEGHYSAESSINSVVIVKMAEINPQQRRQGYPAGDTKNRTGQSHAEALLYIGSEKINRFDTEHRKNYGKSPMNEGPEEYKNARKRKSNRKPLANPGSDNHRRDSTDKKKTGECSQANGQQSRLPERPLVVHFISCVQSFNEFIEGG